MKRFVLAMTALLAVTMSACSQSKQKNDNSMKAKTLVAYFSASGVTKATAQQLANIAHADLCEITPEQPYTDADLDWTNKQSRSTLEMKDKHSRPAITLSLKDLSQYEVVYVGFPIWWYTAPTIINTFLEAYDFTGKTVIPFATSGGSTIEKAEKDLKEAYPNIKWGKGKLLNRVSARDIEAWISNN